MSKKLLMNKKQDTTYWDYEFHSEKGACVDILCSEYMIGSNCVFDGATCIEMKILDYTYSSNDPQIILMVSKSFGFKVFWEQVTGNFRVSGNPNKIADINPPCVLRLELIDSTTGGVYLDGALIYTAELTKNQWITFSGIQKAAMINVSYLKVRM